MKTIMVIPTYWGRHSEIGWQMGDEIYDHPTPIDQEGTLGRTLDSMQVIENKDYELIILVAVTTPELQEEAYKKVSQIVSEHRPSVKTYVIGDSHLSEIKREYRRLSEINTSILSLKGYSNIRNMCLYTAYILEADTAVLIDDDEIFEDPEFMDKAVEFIGGRLYGQTVDAVAGYYLNKKNEYYDDVEIEPWMTFWNRFGSKTKAFDKIIGSEPRLKKTPFAFGGLMVIHRNLFKIVPFDPEMTRGEDIDYVINSRMFGFNFFLDNTLSIKHLPPAKNHAVWQRLRQDIYRFFYEKAKIEGQEERPNMIKIEPEDFDPYPGEFMKPDLEDKVTKTNLILSLDYLTREQVENAKASIKNIYISKYDAVPEYNVFKKYLEVQKNWRELLNFARDNSYTLNKIFKKTQLRYKKDDLDAAVETNFTSLNLDLFQELSEEEEMYLINISEIKQFNPDEIIINSDDINNTLYIILSGKVKISENSENGHEEIELAEMNPGDFFGLTSLIAENNTPYMMDIKAVEPVTLISFNRKDLMEFFNTFHESSIKLLLYFMEKLNEHLKLITDLYAESQHKTQDIQSAIKNGD
ncbi:MULTISPECIES: cyclic nucleotide-binding domain-containing protein [unclassified Halanaerobium]|uniref:cyclic nucleotide-binding domain-containing protein n=1 Tax=unclassified Halanaerobium TaxID=2641197 RepID=UPI000DF35246|nr:MULTISPECIES: cyclic nucleotide-binding domain-containing protein [unclassified Halanaerobium]RCW49880.1 cyclic nucleotide-binding protein [Halanaerobium sp. MA284_MarDTE_T2]RCW88526.1 cyclic nucleotide-binding protein [Halanaerobium sp. DL-01]